MTDCFDHYASVVAADAADRFEARRMQRYLHAAAQKVKVQLLKLSCHGAIASFCLPGYASQSKYLALS
jgi:hypothetical protein